MKKKDLFKEIEDEKNIKRENELRNKKASKTINKLFGEFTKSTSLNKYFKDHIEEFKELYTLSSFHFNDLLKEIGLWIIYNKPEWNEDFKINKIFQKISGIPNSFMKVGKLLVEGEKLSNENNSEYFFHKLRDIIYDNEYSLEDRYKLAIEYKNIIKKYPKLNKFINDSVFSNDEIYRRRVRVLSGEIFNLREDRIYLYEYWKSRKRQFKHLDFKDKKTLFELEKDLVLQNYRLFPILFFFIDYIKEDILRDKLGYETSKKIPNSEAFRYISDLIRQSTSFDLEKYKTKNKLYARIRQRYKEFQEVYEKT